MKRGSRGADPPPESAVHRQHPRLPAPGADPGRIVTIPAGTAACHRVHSHQQRRFVMPILDHLEPRAVFSCFEQLCAIPHGSGNTKAISDYLVRFAAEHQLRCIQDAHNNIIIFAPGTPGYESAARSSCRGTWTWSARLRRTARRTWPARGSTSSWTAIRSAHAAQRSAGTTPSPWPWRWRSWLRTTSPTPRSRSSSPSMRRPACSARPHWTPPC